MHEALALLAVVAAGFWLWHWSSSAREKVLAVSREVCSDLQLQGLDDSVALRRVSLRRDAGRLAVQRTYSFEFSLQGADRHRGEIALLGSDLLWVRLAHPDGPILIDLTGGSA